MRMFNFSSFMSFEKKNKSGGKLSYKWINSILQPASRLDIIWSKWLRLISPKFFLTSLVFAIIILHAFLHRPTARPSTITHPRRSRWMHGITTLEAFRLVFVLYSITNVIINIKLNVWSTADTDTHSLE